METVTIRVYYDFASTLCYVAHRVLTSIEPQIEELGVQLEWVPIDLTMAAPWDRGDSFTDEVRTAVHNTGLTLGIEVEMPDPWLDSRPASHVALKAESFQAEALWRKAVFDSIFEKRTPQLTPEMESYAEELMGPDALPPEGDFELVERCTQDALALGVSGVPTMILDHWMFGGVYDGESMLKVIEELADRFRAQGQSDVN